MAAKQGFLHLNISKTKILATLGLVAVLLLPMVASADQYDVQINALKAQIAQNQAAANQKSSEVDTLKNKLAIISDQINTAQAALTLTSTQISQTNAQIDAENKDLDRQRSILKENLKIVYKQGETSPIELIASSKNLSDFVAQQEYLAAIKKKIDSNLIKIAQIKADLAIKKDSLTVLSSQQQAQVDSINLQKNQQSSLLSQTQGDEAKYQGLVTSQNAQVASLKAQQIASIASLSSHQSYGGSGDYPWANVAQDSGADPWGFYWRECTSYAAWKRSNIGRPIPDWGHWGIADAKFWVSSGSKNGVFVQGQYAQRSGYRVDSIPEVGAVAIFTSGTYGHAMIVKSISGNQVRVMQYNADGNGHFSESDITAGSALYIH